MRRRGIIGALVLACLALSASVAWAQRVRRARSRIQALCGGGWTTSGCSQHSASMRTFKQTTRRRSVKRLDHAGYPLIVLGNPDQLGDITSVVFLVMLQANKDAQDDLKALVVEVDDSHHAQSAPHGLPTMSVHYCRTDFCAA